MNVNIVKQENILGKQFVIYGDIESPLFLAKDIAEWIEHSDPSKMLNNIDAEEKLIRTIFASGQNRDMAMVTEDGLYEILMQSRKPIAKMFKKEVKNLLKNIRVGSVVVIPKTYKEALIALVKAEEEKERLSEKIAIDAPKVDVFDKIMNSEETMDFQEVASMLNIKGIGRTNLFKIFRERNILMADNIPYRKYIDSGYLKVIEVENNGIIKPKTIFTQKGIAWVTRNKEKLLSLQR